MQPKRKRRSRWLLPSSPARSPASQLPLQMPHAAVEAHRRVVILAAVVVEAPMRQRVARHQAERNRSDQSHHP